MRFALGGAGRGFSAGARIGTVTLGASAGGAADVSPPTGPVGAGGGATSPLNAAGGAGAA